MAEIRRAPCPHCGQPVEHPEVGTGQTLLCPHCKGIITSTLPDTRQNGAASPPRTLPLSPQYSPPVPPTVPQVLPELDHAFAEFAHDQSFSGRQPTREQVARAWALASFEIDRSGDPNHQELVAALKKLFKEFRDIKPAPPAR